MLLCTSVQQPRSFAVGHADTTSPPIAVHDEVSVVARADAATPVNVSTLQRLAGSLHVTVATPPSPLPVHGAVHFDCSHAPAMAEALTQDAFAVSSDEQLFVQLVEHPQAEAHVKKLEQALSTVERSALQLDSAHVMQAEDTGLAAEAGHVTGEALLLLLQPVTRLAAEAKARTSASSMFRDMAAQASANASADEERRTT
jgi:hypothetical protein